MNRYDWGRNRSYDWSFRARPPRRYGADFRRHADWHAGPEGSWDWGPAPGERWGYPRGWGARHGYDRGVYGSPYPGYRGYYDRPPARGYGRGYDRGEYRPYARPAGPGRARRDRYDAGMVAEPFLPEAAYERHPELDRPQRHLADRWPSAAAPEYGVERDDGEIRRAVRQNLFNDGFVHADRIEVEVADQVVTLKGEVNDYLEARYAWDDAWEAEGVRGVVNQLTVRTDEAG